MKLFNHDIRMSTRERKDSTHLYSGRVLGLTDTQDKVQLHPELVSELPAIARHYARVGLSHSQDIIWDLSLEELDKHPDREASFYFFGNAVDQQDSTQEWFQQLDLDWWQTVNYINSKNNFMQLAHELDVPVPKTYCFDTKADAISHPDLPFPCYAKLSVSDHGFGIARCETKQDLATALQNLPDGASLQVQEEVNAAVFLNLQYCINGQGVTPVLASEQIMNGCVHGGNRYPTQYQPWEVVEPMAQWLADKGMKGMFAFDVAVVENGNETRYLAIECNPRFNGSSYPTGIAQKLGIQHWSSATYTTPYRSLEEVDLSDLEYDPETGRGVVLVNWGVIRAGELGVLLAGTPEEQTELRQELQQRLNA